MPMLAATFSRRRPTRTASCSPAWMAAATSNTARGPSRSCTTTTNSSPPSRATVPRRAVAARSTPATCTSTSSPAAWPYRSLISLNPSRSQASTATRSTTPGCSSTDCSTSWSSVRLASPVSGSCIARCVSISACSRDSVESRTWTTKWSGAPVGVRTSAASSATHTWWPSARWYRFSRENRCCPPPSSRSTSRRSAGRPSGVLRSSMRYPRSAPTLVPSSSANAALASTIRHSRSTSAMPIGAFSIATRNCISLRVSAASTSRRPVTSTSVVSTAAASPSPAGTSWLATCTMRACVVSVAGQRDADELGVDRPPGARDARAVAEDRRRVHGQAHLVDEDDGQVGDRPTDRRRGVDAEDRRRALGDVEHPAGQRLDEHALLGHGLQRVVAVPQLAATAPAARSRGGPARAACRAGRGRRRAPAIATIGDHRADDPPGAGERAVTDPRRTSVRRRPPPHRRSSRSPPAARPAGRRPRPWRTGRPPSSPGAPRSIASVAGRSSGWTSTSRALEPSDGPTISRDSSRSMRRPALAKPDPQLALQHRRRPELGGDHELGGLQQQVEVVADVLVDLLLDRPRRRRPGGRRLELGLDVLDDGVDLGLGHPRALDAHRLGRAHRQEQRVTLADELLGAGLVEHDARVGRATTSRRPAATARSP